MRVGIIRGDLTGPLFMADLEPTSQTNFPTEPAGQTRYVSRPDATVIAAYLAAEGLVASATGLITATLPVGGPLDVSSATITGVAGLGGATAAQVTALADLIAPKFVDSEAAIKSFQVGNLASYRSANFNPDPNRLPAITDGAAIAVVADDGSTPFAAPLPTISGAASATPNAGDVTITGTGLGSSEWNATKVKFTDVSTGHVTVLDQAVIAATLTGGTQGSVAATSIVVPASLIPTIAAGDTVQVLYTSRASNRFTIT